MSTSRTDESRILGMGSELNSFGIRDRIIESLAEDAFANGHSSMNVNTEITRFRFSYFCESI